MTIAEVSYTDADGNAQVLLAQAGGQDGSTAFVELNDTAYLASDIQGLDLQANPLAQLDFALRAGCRSEPFRRCRLRGGSGQHDPRADPAAGRYFRTGPGQPDPAERSFSAGLI